MLLVEALLELDGNHGFGQLAPPIAIGRQKERARHLHGDGARALVVLAAVPHVGPRRSHDADEVKASMFEETLVLGGKNRVYQHYRQIFIAHGPPLLTRAVEKIGNEFRFDFRGIKLSAAGKRFDGSNALSTELNRQRIVPREIGKLRRPDIDRVRLHGELADGVCILYRAVSHASEISGQIFRSPGLTCRDMFRRGEDLRGVLEDVAGESRIDHARVFDVVVDENSAGGQKNGEDSAQDRQADG